ncbi:hypothetical protein LX16_4367 [Stackebrandtia albiflava]|uniref:Uncharacterized protein n=1 Tax=Stackebrandtia albiflava TaxID=406432 RepID=A0A562URB5_9ACTN|nr:hypothetical protein [Stackebrandtia albiflava]TWJ08147.1 hypothetical protein LX16_4367 [Stackebrandtia albiflava]
MLTYHLVGNLPVAKQLDRFAYQGQTRSQFDRMASYIDPASVAAVAQAFRTDAAAIARRFTQTGRDLLDGSRNRVQWSYGAALLALAAAGPDPAAARTADAALSHLATMDMPAAYRETLHHALRHFPELPAAATTTRALADLLAAEPVDQVLAWAHDIGLSVPFQRWEGTVDVPGTHTPPGPGGRPQPVHVLLDVRWAPGGSAVFPWQVRIGPGPRQTVRILAAAGAARYRVPVSGGTLTGDLVDVPTGPADLPELLRRLEAAHPGLHFDRAAVRTRVTRGIPRKPITTWLTT